MSNEQKGAGLPDYDRALAAAVKQLSYRMLSERALHDKLEAQGYHEEEIGYALAWLTEHRYLSDEQFAQAAAASYTRRGYGALRIRQELRKKGIDDQTASAVLEICTPDLDAMQRLLDKRLHGDLSDRQAVAKAVAALQRRGYRWEDIRRALEAYGTDI